MKGKNWFQEKAEFLRALRRWNGLKKFSPERMNSKTGLLCHFESIRIEQFNRTLSCGFKNIKRAVFLIWWRHKTLYVARGKSHRLNYLVVYIRNPNQFIRERPFRDLTLSVLRMDCPKFKTTFEGYPLSEEGGDGLGGVGLLSKENFMF